MKTSLNVVIDLELSSILYFNNKDDIKCRILFILFPRLFSSSVGFSPTNEENCELSDKNTYDLDIDNPAHYEQSERFDHYQREARAAAATDNCIDGNFIFIYFNITVQYYKVPFLNIITYRLSVTKTNNAVSSVA